MTLGECGEGCIKCSPEDACLVCNHYNFFILSPESKSCVKKIMENCEIIDFNGNCTHCTSGFYLDSGQCVKVTSEIQNCKDWKSQTSCSLCHTNFALKNSGCVAAVTILGCQNHLEDTTVCHVCQQEKIKSIDQKFCLDADSTANCQSYNFVDCEECMEGYILDKRGYQIQANQELKEESEVFGYTLSILETQFRKKGQSNWGVCVKIQVENCLEYISFDKCKKCQKGYLLIGGGQCIKNPEDNLKYCSKYSNRTTCIECQNRFFMNSQGNCTAQSEIAKCIEYSRTVNGECILCDDGLFFDQTDCKERNISKEIPHCKLLSPQADSCQDCEDKFEINSEGNLCLPEVKFCAEYRKEKTVLYCLQCIDKYFLNEGHCQIGEIDQCKTYSTATSCKTCENNYYLTNNFQCAQNELTDLLVCLESESDEKNKCTKCSNDRVIIQLMGVCKPVNVVIQNCEEYNDADTCLKCKSQFSYLSGKVCKLGTIENCVLYHQNKNICLQCQIDLVTGVSFVTYPKNSENNKCVEENKNILQNCKKISLENDSVMCQECDQFHYPLLFPSKYQVMCVAKDFYAINSNISLDNCLVYNPLQSRCLRCEMGKFVSSEGICVDSCEVQQLVRLYKLEPSEEDSYVKEFLECSPRSLNLIQTGDFNINSPLQCAVVSPHLNNGVSTNYCVSCGSDQIGLILPIQKIIDVDFTNYPFFISKHFTNRHFSINQCFSSNITISGETNSIQTLVATYMDSNQNLVPASLKNCKLLKRLANNKYGCSSCIHGYTGKVVRISDWETANVSETQRLQQEYFIDKCSVVEDCVTNIYIKGLGYGEKQHLESNVNPFPLSYLVSCHRCANNNIVTYGKVLKAQGIYSLGSFFPFRYSTEGEKDYIPADQLGNVNQTACKPPGLGLRFVLNCAVQEVLVNLPIMEATNLSEGNPRCVACQPGFKPTWRQNADGTSTLVDFFSYITECTIITNCDSSNSSTFNRCDQCRGIYSLVYDESKPEWTDYSECRKSEEFNCLVYDFTQKNCVKCFKNYVLNKDGICDSINLYKCEQKGFQQAFSQSSLEALFPLSIGCLECEEGFIGIFFLEKQRQCALSYDLQTGTSIEKSNMLIQNCASYGPQENQEDKIICVDCNEGYVLSYSGKFCHQENQDILNCRRYKEDASGCSLCDTMFYLDSRGFCHRGKIENCLVYRSQNECTKCDSTHLLIKIKGNKILCFKKPSLDCEVFESETITNSQISCKQCKKNHYFLTDTDVLGFYPLNYCIEIPSLLNCQEYDNKPNIVDSTLSCVKCKREYYIKNSICVMRTNTEIDKCLQLADNADQCQKCEENYYISPEGLCNVFPKGITDCEDYLNEVTCVLCKENHYLIENTCVQVTLDFRVPNCKYYDALSVCNGCESGFFLKSESLCIETVAQNCLTFIDEKNCQSCPSGYGLLKQSNGDSCKKIDILSCETPESELQNGNFVCKKCDMTFYKNDEGKCISVPKKIDNCAYYSSATTCSQCLKGYILTKDKKQCKNDMSLKQFADPHCKVPLEKEEPVCNMCKASYTFKDDIGKECVQCSEEGSKGCLICDFKDPKVCLICGGDYYMDKTGTCIVKIEEKTEITLKNVPLLDKMLLIVLSLLIQQQNLIFLVFFQANKRLLFPIF